MHVYYLLYYITNNENSFHAIKMYNLLSMGFLLIKLFKRPLTSQMVTVHLVPSTMILSNNK